MGRFRLMTRPDEWGQWHEGERYDIRLGRALYYDEGGYHTRVDVEIRDKATGEVHQRAGEGKQIGNFHPVWINWQGRSVQVEQLLREGV